MNWLQLNNHTKLLAGSAGWAEFLPEVFLLNTSLQSKPELAAPMLIVNGSLHENSLRQVAYAVQYGIPVIDFQAHAAVQHTSEKIAATGHAIFTTNTASLCAQATENLANIVCQILAQSHVKTLIVFGGDTLAAIAQALDWKVFRPRAEILPGVPIVEICEQENILLITKAGGFGAEDLLIRLKLSIVT